MLEKTENSEYIGEERQLERMRADKFVCDVVGVRLTEVGVGTARAELTLRPDHMNGVNICQGGVLFTLADFAIASACNYTEAPVVVGEMSISFCKSAKTGKIIAEAREISRSRSTTVGEATVRDESGKVLCVARARGFVLQPR